MPVLAIRDNAPVLRFAINSKAFVNSGAGEPLPMSELTYACRAYFSNDTTNFQKILDFGKRQGDPVG